MTPIDCSPPGFSVHGISQARILERVAISSSGNLSNPRIEPVSPTLTGGYFCSEPPGKPSLILVLHLWWSFKMSWITAWFLVLFNVLFLESFIDFYKSLWTYDLGRIMASQSCPCPNSWNPWICSFTWPRRPAGVILKTLRCDIILNYPGHPTLIPWVHKGREDSRVDQWYMTEDDLTYLLWL